MSRFCPVTASSSESKPIRLSATRVNSILPVCGAAQPSVPDPGRRRALPLGVRGVDLDDAVAAPAPREDAVDDPLAHPAAGEGQLHLALGRAQRVDAAGDPKLAGQRVVKSRPVSAPRSRREKRSRRRSAPQRGGSRVANAVGLEGADLAAELGVHLQPRQRARALEPAAHFAPRLQRGERAADPIEGERLQRHVGGEAERIEAGVEVHQADGHAGRPVAVPVPRPCPGRSRCGAAPPGCRWRRAAPRESPPGAISRTVRRSMSELRTSKPVKTSPSSRPRADAAFAGDGADRIARHPRVGEGPVDPHVERVEESGAGDAAGQRAVERQRVEIGPHRVEVEVAELEPHVAHAEARGAGR